ncbi:MAG TPA: UTP--glucose-1-phosphate uridylyltransferase [Jatrophihabitans sp.]|nr:UTP--glucose-1-phosphate uridylyltransferase [Jatrophihabitans sp.]
MSEEGLRRATEKMAAADVAEDAIAAFANFYRQIEEGASGLIAEADIAPLTELDALADLDVDDAQLRAAADVTAVIKLNGGLGTSMGMDRAKSLLPVKGDLRFLDIIIRQTLQARRRFGARLPLIFMNSFRTREDVRAVLAQYPELPVGELPADFLQNREPKLLADTLEPVDWPAQPDLEWCPPGHGDLYPALRSTGLLAQLIDSGFRYAFCSNADNLGATIEPRIPAWMAAHDIPFLMESCRRTPADRKGGHLAIRRSDGRLILRETAQTSEADMQALADLDRHRYCNTNNVWLDLGRLQQTLDAAGGVLDLPVIRNVKTVDPADPDTPEVIQIESAMGAAVQCFAGAKSLLVERSRFVPVKTTNDLLVLRSDAYDLAADYTLRVAPGREVGRDPFVDLDPRFFKYLADFDRRFPDGPVSLVECDRFVVEGDVSFGAGVIARGDVQISSNGGSRRVEPGTVLT